jgi:hypothetical protein
VKLINTILVAGLFVLGFGAGCGTAKKLVECEQARTREKCNAEEFEAGKFNCVWVDEKCKPENAS